MLLSKVPVSILAIVLVCVWRTQAGCLHLKSTIENPANTRLKPVNSATPWRSTRNPIENTDDRHAERPRSREPQDVVDLSISICSSESSADSRRDRDGVDSYGVASFEVVLPSLKVLSNKKTPLRFPVPIKSPSRSRRIYQTTSKKSPPSLNKLTYDVSSSSLPEGSYERMHPVTIQSSRTQPPRPREPHTYVSQHYPSVQQPPYLPSHLPVTYTSIYEPSQQLPPPPSCNLAPLTEQFHSPAQSSSHTPSTYPHSPLSNNRPLTLFSPALTSSSREFPSDAFAAHSINEPTFRLPPPMEPAQSTSLQLYQPRRHSDQQHLDNEYFQPAYTPVESQPIYSGHSLTK